MPEVIAGYFKGMMAEYGWLDAQYIGEYIYIYEHSSSRTGNCICGKSKQFLNSYIDVLQSTAI